MREILFRGKNIETDEWVHGDVFHSTGFALIMPDGTLMGTQIVDPATVGQYTGLTDKNGKKIFEGDVVECWSRGVKAQGVVHRRIDGLWIIYPAYQQDSFWGLCPNADGTTTVEVIGNIHDNPELLEATP